MAYYLGSEPRRRHLDGRKHLIISWPIGKQRPACPSNSHRLESDPSTRSNTRRNPSSKVICRQATGDPLSRSPTSPTRFVSYAASPRQCLPNVDQLKRVPLYRLSHQPTYCQKGVAPSTAPLHLQITFPIHQISKKYD